MKNKTKVTIVGVLFTAVYCLFLYNQYGFGFFSQEISKTITLIPETRSGDPAVLFNQSLIYPVWLNVFSFFFFFKMLTMVLEKIEYDEYDSPTVWKNFAVSFVGGFVAAGGILLPVLFFLFMQFLFLLLQYSFAKEENKSISETISERDKDIEWVYSLGVSLSVSLTCGLLLGLLTLLLLSTTHLFIHKMIFQKLSCPCKV